MKRLTLVLLTLSVVLAVRPAHAQDGIQNVAFFYPLRTRRPVIERELEIRVEHAKTADGRVTEAAAAVELPILPRWQVELEVPLIFREPREGAAQGGVGDLRVENKVMVWQSLDWLSQVALGVEGRLPTGSERRGLGGEAGVEPFVTGGIALGDVDLLASVAYEFNLNAHVPGPNEQELTASAAAAWRVTRRFAPLLELVTVTRTRAAQDDELRHKTRVSLVPGFNAKVLPGTTLRLGVEVPLTRARTADYTLLGGFVKEF
jgi:hypothetical protein